MVWQKQDEQSYEAEGVVKWFNDQKGYGFIVPDDGGKEIFVHYSDIQVDGFRTLYEGQRVKYDIERSKQGQKATNVRPEVKKKKSLFD